MILGALVAGWHVPLVAMGQLGPIGLVTTMAITFIYVWLFNRTNGSVLLTLVFHAAQGALTFGHLGFTGADAVRAEWLYAAVVVIVAVGLVTVDRRAWRSAPEAATQQLVSAALGHSSCASTSAPQ